MMAWSHCHFLVTLQYVATRHELRQKYRTKMAILTFAIIIIKCVLFKIKILNKALLLSASNDQLVQGYYK